MEEIKELVTEVESEKEKTSPISKKQKLEYLKKIIKLSSSEKKRRDEDLKMYINGIKPGPQTAFPYFNKRWLVDYNYDNCPEFETKNNLYLTYESLVQDKLDKPAVYVYETGKEYTNREIIELVDKASAGFVNMGIGADSTVGLILDGSIEEVVAFLALQKIGAKTKYIDYMKSMDAIKHNFEEEDLDLLIIDEGFLPLEKEINQKGIKTVIANNKVSEEDDNHIYFDRVYEKGEGYTVPAVPYIDGKVVATINSSGTTGPAKPINLTAENCNASSTKMMHSDLISDFIVKMIPSNIGLGLITSLYTALLSDSELVLIGGRDIELVKNINGFVREFPEFVEKKGMPDAKMSIFTAPMFVRALLHDESVNDLSYVESILAAGSKISEEELDYLEALGRKKGLKNPICNGYGQNEMAGAVTLNHNSSNVNGSAGFPVYNTDVIVVDPVTFELLPSNEEGLILERSDSLFKEYNNMPERTKEAHVYLDDEVNDDVAWFNTSDLGYMDENGFLYITGRISRVVIRNDFKISLDNVENTIRTMDNVVDCATIPASTGGSVEEIAVFMKPADKNATPDDLYETLQTNSGLSEFEMPSEVYIVKEIPYKGHGKIDYVKLKEYYSTIPKNSYIEKQERKSNNFL